MHVLLSAVDAVEVARERHRSGFYIVHSTEYVQPGSEVNKSFASQKGSSPGNQHRISYRSLLTEKMVINAFYYSLSAFHGASYQRTVLTLWRNDWNFSNERTSTIQT